MDKSEILRTIPQIEKLLQNEDVQYYIKLLGRESVVSILREVTDRFKSGVIENGTGDISTILKDIVEQCRRKGLEKLRKVINGTGVVIHTNLGRSPLSESLFEAMSEELSGYVNLELLLTSGKRGKRGGFAEELLCHLTGAEDALIVNNNAASVFLILSQFGKGKEVIVSRGELIQIGGGFRIPDIMNQTGAELIEVGTTNITELEDYRKAINENTSMIFSAHRSNFAIQGFTREPSGEELALLKTSGIIYVRDVGSGNLIEPGKYRETSAEPTIRMELKSGADLVCFSGDKLLGSCQAGIITGRGDLIEKLRENPLMRILRVDKITYYLLQETLIHYENNEPERVLMWQVASQDIDSISTRIRKVLELLPPDIKEKYVRETEISGVFGGGSLPATEINSRGIELYVPESSADDIYSHMMKSDVPVIGYVKNSKFLLDFRTILDRDIPHVSSAIEHTVISLKAS